MRATRQNNFDCDVVYSSGGPNGAERNFIVKPNPGLGIRDGRSLGLHDAQRDPFGTGLPFANRKLTELLEPLLEVLYEEPSEANVVPRELAERVLFFVKKGADPNLLIDEEPLLFALRSIRNLLPDESMQKTQETSGIFSELYIELVKTGANPAIEYSDGETGKTFNFFYENFYGESDLDSLSKFLLIEPTAVGNLTGATLLHQFIETGYCWSPGLFDSRITQTEYNHKFANIVRAMIDAGANPRKENNENESAQDIAIKLDLPDEVKQALGINIDEPRLSLVELYEGGQIEELLEQKTLVDLNSDRDNVIKLMIQKNDIDTLEKFLSPGGVDFSKRSDFWAEELNKAWVSLLQSKSSAKEEVVLFLLSNGVNPDYPVSYNINPFSFIAEAARKGLLPKRITEAIREHSLYLSDRRFECIHDFLDRFPSFPALYEPNCNVKMIQSLRNAYTEYILNPIEDNWESFRELFDSFDRG